MTNLEKYDFLTTNMKGIGPNRADKIIEEFKDVDSILDFLHMDNVYARLNKVMSPKMAVTFVSQLKEIEKQGENIQLMTECGISYVQALGLSKNEIEFKCFLEDPYKIGMKENLDFASCDKFAHQFFKEKCPDMTESRMTWFIDAMLEELENSGNTFSYFYQLAKKLNSYQKKNQYTPTNYSSSVILLYTIDNDRFEIEKIGSEVKKWKIYRKKTFLLESDIAYHIKRLANNQTVLNGNGYKSKTMMYDDIQLAAINSASMSGLKIITGPPGSGKTAVINGIISYFKELKPQANVILCAPTGRAAKHMTEITGECSTTIHKLLGMREDCEIIKMPKLECDILICDEASMLNLDVTYELLSHIQTGTVVYFVGDKDQLPAVGAGNVLHDIINSNKVPTYHLTKVYRQDGLILNNAHLINKGEMPTKTSKMYQVVSYDDEIALRDKAVDLFKSLYDPREPFETQILIPSYQTECGIVAINKEVQKLNPEPFIYVSRGNGYDYKRNDKILMTKNSVDGLYQNGSVGIFLANRGEELLVDFEGEQILLPRSAIEDMSLGYAISVHKSQGSEYKHVIFCLPSKPQNMLQRNILYTGVTRAKKDITLLEMNGSIKKCVETCIETFQQTGLRNKLTS